MSTTCIEEIVSFVIVGSTLLLGMSIGWSKCTPFFVKSHTVFRRRWRRAQRRQQVALTGTINLVAVVVSSYFSLALDSNQGLA